MENNIENINNTNFLGIVVDIENGSSNPKVNKALEMSATLFDIIKFIEVTKFELNNVYVLV